MLISRDVPVGFSGEPPELHLILVPRGSSLFSPTHLLHRAPSLTSSSPFFLASPFLFSLYASSLRLPVWRQLLFRLRIPWFPTLDPLPTRRIQHPTPSISLTLCSLSILEQFPPAYPVKLPLLFNSRASPSPLLCIFFRRHQHRLSLFTFPASPQHQIPSPSIAKHQHLPWEPLVYIDDLKKRRKQIPFLISDFFHVSEDRSAQ